MKKIDLYIVLALMLGTFTACGKVENPSASDNNINNLADDGANTNAEAEKSLTYITVSTAETNPDNAWMVNWPKLVVTDNFKNFNNKLENPILSEDLSPEEIDYFIDYISSLPMQDYLTRPESKTTKEDYAGHLYLGSVDLTYTETDGSQKTITRYLFDEYPEGYDTFIEKFGEICGEDYITLNCDIQEVTVEYFRRMAKLDDSIDDTRIEEFLEIAQPDMFHLIETYNYFVVEDIFEYFSYFKHSPREVLSASSTEDELQTYALEVATKFGASESDIYTTKDGGVGISAGKYGSINIYPTASYPDASLITEYDWDGISTTFYHIEDSNGPEGMVSVYIFVYSDDGKFIVILPGNNYEGTNEMIKTLFDE